MKRIHWRKRFTQFTSIALLLSIFQGVGQESASAAAGNFGSSNCSSYFSDTANLSEVSVTDYCVVKILSGTATWTIPSEIYSFSVAVVGGGGGGGNNVGDGGGGGAVVFGQVIKGSATTFTATVGSGGTGGTYSVANNGTTAMDGQNGSASTFISNDGAVSISAGGGTGGQTHWDNNQCGGSGTSLSTSTAGGVVNSSTGISVTGKISSNGSQGGKANGSGVQGSSGSAGTSLSILASAYKFGAGGAAGGWGANGGSGGLDGGGAGGNYGSSVIPGYAGTSGTANSGGGGGSGGDNCGNGGNGGSGVVIIRWAPVPTCTSVTFSGTSTFNETLTASSSCSKYTGLSYTWWRSASSSFTSSTYITQANSYRLVSADVGKYVKSAAYLSNSRNFAVEVSTSTTIYSATGASTVAKANQTITFDTPTAKTYGDSAFTLSASDTTTSGLAITYTSATTGICTIATATVTIVSAGTCTINANQSGNSNYNAATQVSRSFTINKASQSTLTITSTSGTYGTAILLTTIGGSGTGAVSYTRRTNMLPPGSPTCTVSSDSLTASSSGYCYVTATKATDSNYSAVSSTETAIYFAKLSQNVVITSLGVSSTSYPYSQVLSPTVSGALSDGALTYAIDAGGTASNCALTNNLGTYTLTASTSGTCLITVTSATDSRYLAATSSPATFTFNKAAQSITLTTLTTSSKSYPYTQALSMSTSGSSGSGAITYAIESGGTATGCALSNSTATATITATTSGTCLVKATIATDTNYEAATSTSLTFTFSKANQTLTFASLGSTSTKAYPYSIQLLMSTSGSSGTGAVTYSVASPSGTASDCALSTSGSTATLSATSIGTCLLQAAVAADNNYNSATSGTLTFTFTKANQSALIVGNYPAYPTRSVYPLNVYGGSGTGLVTRSLVSAGTAGCVFSNSYFLDATSPGTCTVQVVKAADSNYFTETTTATIHWIAWNDSYAIQVPSVPTQITLQHQTQIVKYSYDTLTVTSYASAINPFPAITSISAGAPLRIIGVGFDANDLTTQVTFAGNEIAIPYLITATYIEVETPLAASTGRLIVDTSKGSALGPSLTITPMMIL